MLLFTLIVLGILVFIFSQIKNRPDMLSGPVIIILSIMSFITIFIDPDYKLEKSECYEIKNIQGFHNGVFIETNDSVFLLTSGYTEIDIRNKIFCIDLYRPNWTTKTILSNILITSLILGHEPDYYKYHTK